MEDDEEGLSSADSRLLTRARPSMQTGRRISSSPYSLLQAKRLALRWEARYQEAAIYLQEGFENDSFASHPRDASSMQAYRFVHTFHILDVSAAILLMALALVEFPAVDKLQMPTQGHALVELLLLVVLAMDLFMRMRWLKWRRVYKHKRIILKTLFLAIMLTEAIAVAVREKSHFRITRCLRPLFLLDSYYCMGARRVARQIVQSLPPILDMIMLLLFIMVIFSVFGYFLFSENPNDPNFSSFKNSFVSLFILVTTANYPDVMMPAYNYYQWAPAFFIIYLCITLYILLNLLTAVVYSTFQEFEKRKFRKLLLHQREAVRKMFNLLCGQRRISLPFIHFRGVMRYYRPAIDDVSCRCVFKVLNTSGSGRLTLEECYPVYEAVLLRWSRIDGTMQEETWYTKMPKPVWKMLHGINRLVEHRFFHYFIILTIVGNCVFMLQDAASGQVDQHGANAIASTVFTAIYTMEACLKILGLGPRQYFAHSWNMFDFVIVIMSLIGLLAQASHLRFFVVLRPLRLLRLLELKKRYQDVLATLFVLLPRMANVGLLLIVFFYFFAIIGMEFFPFKVSPGCCVNSSVSTYYSVGPNTVFYYLNSFDNILRSYVTLFELMIVNNWFVIMDGYVSETSEWARVYFMMFYLMSLMVVNIVVAFILDAFLFRIESQKDGSAALEGDLSLVEISLSQDEVQDRRDATSLSILADPTEVKFKGRRRRTKADLSLMMYRDEIKEWCHQADTNPSADLLSRNSVVSDERDGPASMETLASEDADSSSSNDDGKPVMPVDARLNHPFATRDSDPVVVHRDRLSGQVSPVHLSHSSVHYDSTSAIGPAGMFPGALGSTSTSTNTSSSVGGGSMSRTASRHSTGALLTAGASSRHMLKSSVSMTSQMTMSSAAGVMDKATHDADDWTAFATNRMQKQSVGGGGGGASGFDGGSGGVRKCTSELPSPSHPDSGAGTPRRTLRLSHSVSEINSPVNAGLLSANLSNLSSSVVHAARGQHQHQVVHPSSTNSTSSSRTGGGITGLGHSSSTASSLPGSTHHLPRSRPSSTAHLPPVGSSESDDVHLIMP
ncbi:two pore channel protein 1-like [Sycon ciliatum]|uniref:two pore channel protein 1-like n=1 Tax=Sycon ciliatum TaxID=27933 RepID=UPI0031F6764B